MYAPTAFVVVFQRRKRPLRMLGTVCPKHVNKASPPREHPVNVALSVRNSVIILFFLSAAEAKDATKVRTFYGLTKKKAEKVGVTLYQKIQIIKQWLHCDYNMTAAATIERDSSCCCLGQSMCFSLTGAVLLL